MKGFIAILSVLILAPAFAADIPAQPAAAPAKIHAKSAWRRLSDMITPRLAARAEPQ